MAGFQDILNKIRHNIGFGIGFTLTLQDTRSIHDSMNLPKMEFISYIYILYYHSRINFKFSPNMAGFQDILNKIRHNIGFGIGFTLTLQDTRSIHDSMNLPKMEFISYIYILYYHSHINFKFSPNMAGFQDILNKIRHNIGFGIGFTLTLQDTRSIHDSMNLPKMEFISYIYILYYHSRINFKFSPNMAGFQDILNKIRHNIGFWNSQNAKFPRLTSWRYVFNVAQMSVNKQRYWMDLTLARSHGLYVGVA